MRQKPLEALGEIHVAVDEGAHVGEQLSFRAILLRRRGKKHDAMREKVVLGRIRNEGHSGEKLHLALASPVLSIKDDKPRRRRGGVVDRFDHFARGRISDTTGRNRFFSGAESGIGCRCPF